MSDTSIHFKDEGYTSPDFLTNLFKKPLYSSISLSSFETSPQSCRDINSSTKQNDLPTLSFEKKSSSPLKFKNHTSNMSKYYKSTPVIDEEKISNSKYKIFFKTVLHGVIGQQQLNQLWTQLQESIKNPFSFDKFIDEIKERKDKEAQLSNELPKQIQRVLINKVRSKTPQKSSKREPVSFNTQQKGSSKRIDSKTSIRDSIKQNVIDIRDILLRGQKVIRQRK